MFINMPCYFRISISQCCLNTISASEIIVFLAASGVQGLEAVSDRRQCGSFLRFAVLAEVSCDIRAVDLSCCDKQG